MRNGLGTRLPPEAVVIPSEVEGSAPDVFGLSDGTRIWNGDRAERAITSR
jgi:hypothetical protein